MLGFIISTIAFSLVAYALNRYFDSKSRRLCSPDKS
jgi:hypothetical protein